MSFSTLPPDRQVGRDSECDDPEWIDVMARDKRWNTGTNVLTGVSVGVNPTPTRGEDGSQPKDTHERSEGGGSQPEDSHVGCAGGSQPDSHTW
jgi:hypothetical protein